MLKLKIVITNKLIALSAFITFTLSVIALFYALYQSPVDYQQGEFVRLMYIHVPSAWLALGLYMAMFICSVLYLIYYLPILDIISRAVSLVGCMFAFATLATGSIWGKYIWGTWWVWDARLTSMFFLFICYLVYILLSFATHASEAGAKSRAALAILGGINIPIIKFSVNFWNSLHQQSGIIRFNGSSVDHTMLVPLILMFITLAFYALTIILLRIKNIIKCKKINREKLI